jgi:hypothetical protein
MMLRESHTQHRCVFIPPATVCSADKHDAQS